MFKTLSDNPTEAPEDAKAEQISAFNSALRNEKYKTAIDIAIGLLGNEVAGYIFSVLNNDLESTNKVYRETCRLLEQELPYYEGDYSHLRFLYFRLVHQALNQQNIIKEGETSPDEVQRTWIAEAPDKLRETIATQVRETNIPDKSPFVMLRQEMLLV